MKRRFGISLLDLHDCNGVNQFVEVQSFRALSASRLCGTAHTPTTISSQHKIDKSCAADALLEARVRRLCSINPEIKDASPRRNLTTLSRCDNSKSIVFSEVRNHRSTTTTDYLHRQFRLRDIAGVAEDLLLHS
jgi:hypothetical protein